MKTEAGSCGVHSGTERGKWSKTGEREYEWGRGQRPSRGPDPAQVPECGVWRGVQLRMAEGPPQGSDGEEGPGGEKSQRRS